ncbi:alpha/beta hydrolase [Actinomadura sp. GC306]|uniref:alpha/beta hydrolase n=1 Tax=Actinomadura sp. GC306 TaxID=2530367 RepID=UPI00104F1E4E|nr:alpha/beta hydrolase [Actinomadura sp. GC306]TDC71569.1 alpha/beta hydrolase [Actinomadura sp. GC306]
MVLLDPDAQALVDAATAAGVKTFRETGIEGIRSRLESLPPAPAPEMAEVEDLAFEGPHGTVPVRLYRPRAGVGPAIVYLHGGGMVMGTLDSFDGLARNLAASCAAVVLSIEYRLAPEHRYPVASDEAYAAVAWAHANAAGLGIDPARIAVAGDSAGGSLAAGAALRSRDENGPPIAVQMLFYPGLERAVDRPSMIEFADGPVLTRPDVIWMKEQYLGPDESADTEYGVPALARDLSDLPDAIVVTAEADPLRDAAEEYGRRLRDAAVPTALLRYPGVCHGFLSQAARLRRARAAFTEIGALARAKFGQPA